MDNKDTRDFLNKVNAIELTDYLKTLPKQVNLYLHNTPPGRQYTIYAQYLDDTRYRDFNRSYQNYSSITRIHIETAQAERELISNSKKF